MKRISKEKLQDLYYNHTNEEVANMLGITKVTLIKYVRDAGIPMKGKGMHLRKLEVTR